MRDQLRLGRGGERAYHTGGGEVAEDGHVVFSLCPAVRFGGLAGEHSLAAPARHGLAWEGSVSV